MKNAKDFIMFALSHAKQNTIPKGAKLPMDIEECGTEEWEYLPGAAGETVTEELLEAKFDNFYKRLGWSKERFDIVTENFARKHVKACDSQGLMTSFTGMEATPNFCYSAWCTDKGEIASIRRAYALGEAVFYMNADGTALHTGFICGSIGGEPLVVEARGIGFGVCVTRLSDRPWTHRGLCTKRLIYEENCYDEQMVLKLQKPMLAGEAIRSMQQALNMMGYFCGPADGKFGKFTSKALKEFIDVHTTKVAL